MGSSFAATSSICCASKGCAQGGGRHCFSFLGIRGFDVEKTACVLANTRWEKIRYRPWHERANVDLSSVTAAKTIGSHGHRAGTGACWLDRSASCQEAGSTFKPTLGETLSSQG